MDAGWAFEAFKVCRADRIDASEVVREIEGWLRLRSITGVGRGSVKDGDIDHYDRKQ